MPESKVDSIDYFPQGWTEEVIDENLIEWRYEEDESILVRVDGTIGEEGYSVTPITGINNRGEEYVTKPVSELSRKEALETAVSFVYAINGAIGRVSGASEFNGDQS